MASTTTCRRRHRRHRIAPEAGARVELVFPQPNGAPMSLPLLDISAGGLSFAFDNGLEELDCGDSLSRVTLCIGDDCRIRGELMIMHVTVERGVCGALFFPATDEELIKYRTVIAGIEAVQRG